MKVEMLRSRGYRGNHAEAGSVLDMDDTTAREFIHKGYAREHADREPLTAEAADALIPTKVTRRRARI
jgi:hypothetical protein